MKYRDLIQFEAVTEVIQLLKANQKETAAHLVETYVISDRMADVILHRILPALSLDSSRSGRGLFIVGNYGAGKSHLMAVISAICEHVDLLERIQHPAVRQGLEELAGRFIVVRQETAATKMALRDVVFNDLGRQLANLGVTYHFPALDETISNKQLLSNMMTEFRAKFPDKGLFIVLDELLDYLRSRNEIEIILDLNFLREVGEACEILPLRFVAGIQEALFDNPRFSFVADSIKRVQARFDQSKIIKEDVAYVISHRLLSKTNQQKLSIRKHLEQFTPLYTDMAERLDEFIELFPVHPTYLEVFEQVSIGERRDLLKALSTEMTALLDHDVPIGKPGLITYDSYWRMICEDDAFRTIPDVRLVQEKARVLSDKVKYSNETANYREAALQIIDGLALNRLTVSDIYAPIGVTPTELKDQLCLYLPLPELDADFLLATVETILRAISTAVNGQFISHNPENDQYYLDLKKDIDFDALIDQKAKTLDPTTLDRYYFEIIKMVLEITEGSYVTGFRIWEKEIPWTSHGITRQGYLFLGASNERSTTHPERDFYIHFHSPFGNGKDVLSDRPDEIFFLLNLDDPRLEKYLRSYAGTAEMAAISTGANRDQYEKKLRDHGRTLTRYLTDNFIRFYEIHYNQQTKPVAELISDFHINLRGMNFRDMVHKISSTLFEPAFEIKYPDYPSFEGVELNSKTLDPLCEQALRTISGSPASKMTQVILEGLKLGKVQQSQIMWDLHESPYASYYLDLVNQLPAGTVVNRGEILKGEPGAETDQRFGLEPTLFALVLAALVKQGLISLNLRGWSVSELNTEETRLSLDQILNFVSISKPKPIPEKTVRELFSHFDVPPALLDDLRSQMTAVDLFQKKLSEEQERVVRMLNQLRSGPKLGQQMILPSQEQAAVKKTLEEYLLFLNGLTKFNSYARFSNLDLGVGEIHASMKGRNKLEELSNIFESIYKLTAHWDYLKEAKKALPEEDPWSKELETSQDYILKALTNPEARSNSSLDQQIIARLDNLKHEYVQHYLELHQSARLDREQDQRKKAITSDPKWAVLRALGKLNLLPSSELNHLIERIKGLRSCTNLRAEDLTESAVCPYCTYIPAMEEKLKVSGEELDEISEDLGATLNRWTTIIHDNLTTDQAQKNLGLVSEKTRKVVEEFIQSNRLPDPLTESFIEGVKDTLQGIEVIQLDGAALLYALTGPGMPCLPEEVERRFRAFLGNQLEGKDPQKLRIQIDW
ncbi:MAG: ATP-binding protein [Chloroflexi bacterium]|nr:ATP-binding protein [Chloroflexota bacterium]